MPLGADFTVRFWAKVDKSGSCWLWKGAISADGYGNIMTGHRGKCLRAHRVAYELLVGPIPSGLTLDHLCRNRACVNPRHLEAVTNKENILRGEASAAVNARKESCKRGHLLSGANLYVQPNGQRECRTCKAMRDSTRVRQRSNA